MADSDIPVFYCTEAESYGGMLDDGESHHCFQVLRLRQGQQIGVVDGKGMYHAAVIVSGEHGRCRFETTGSRLIKNHPYRLHIAMAPAKSTDRFEWFLEKAVEIGVDELTPLVCHRSVRTQLRHGRLQKTMISAMKQSQSATLPVLNGFRPFRELVTAGDDGLKFICTRNGSPDAFANSGTGGQYLFLVGPEGDFTEEEMTLAVQHGFIPLSLGAMRLRTETAGVHICSMVSFVHSGKL